MSFAPGDEVVCVDGKPRAKRTKPLVMPIEGRHYVIRDFTDDAPGGVHLVEIVNEPRMCASNHGLEFCEPWFRVARFRPVRRESIEIFRQMCVSKKPLIPVEG